MKILIIGGGGLIGSGLENLLFDEGNETVVLDTFTGSSLSLAGIKGTVITGNATSFSTMNRVFSSFSPEVVFNFVDASADKEGYYNFQQEAEVYINTSMNLARCIELYGCVKHVFLGSSCDVYKGGSKRKLKESSPTDVLSYTGISKKYVEDMFLLLSDSMGFSFTAIRFFQVFGNRFFINPKYDVISVYLDSLIRGYQLAIAGPKTFVDALNITDAVSASYIIYMSVVSGSDIKYINVGSGEPISLIDLYKRLVKEFEVSVKPTLISAGKHTRSLVADVSLLKSLGWDRLNSLDETIHNLINFRMRTINDRPKF